MMIRSWFERMISHTGTETRSRLLREAAVGNFLQWAKTCIWLYLYTLYTRSCTGYYVLLLIRIVQAIQSPDHVRQKFVKNLQRKVNAAITDKSRFPGFRSPTSWSTLLRRHSVACWSVITTTGARASCG